MEYYVLGSHSTYYFNFKQSSFCNFYFVISVRHKTTNTNYASKYYMVKIHS